MVRPGSRLCSHVGMSHPGSLPWISDAECHLAQFELYKRVRVLCCHRGVKLMARLNMVTYDQIWFWHDQIWWPNIKQYDFKVGFNNLAPRFPFGRICCSCLVPGRRGFWYRLKKLPRSWYQVLRGGTLYGDLAAETGTTIQHLQPNGPTYDRWIPGTSGHLWSWSCWSCGFRSLFEDIKKYDSIFID